VAAVPVLLAGCKTDWQSYSEFLPARPEFKMGADFVAANSDRVRLLFWLARLVCIPFSLLGGYFCYRWACELYGIAAGYLALTLWCFCPNIVANGQLITSDVAASSFGLWACYSFWRWLKEPTWRRTITSGLVLGLSELTKTTLVIFYPLWPIAWFIYRLAERTQRTRDKWLRELGMLVARSLIGLYLINLGYAFEGTGTPLKDFTFVSECFGGKVVTEMAQQGEGNRFSDSWIGVLPVPLPKYYVLGIDLQRRDFEHYFEPSYLHGTFQDTGWWYYYVYALAIKVPLGSWLLFVVSLCSLHKVSGSACVRDEAILLFPAAVIFVFVSSQTGFSEHMRYVLPCFPFTYVFISRTAHLVFTSIRWSLIVMVPLAWSMVSTALVYPHCLSYFNELGGGPVGGKEHLINSNIDWGQDLYYLKAWMAENPEASPLNLVCFGFVRPHTLGIDFVVPEEFAIGGRMEGVTEAPPLGWYAISVNFLQGLEHSSYLPNGSQIRFGRHALSRFKNAPPVAMVGYSIYIYHIQADETVIQTDTLSR
jgi:4-amino-4-deoxy-L-arabinose transferase-like glycosyltransferase